jgi:hypothetical protein
MLKKQMTLTAGEESVTAVNAATNINKLLQISGGAVYSPTAVKSLSLMCLIEYK